MCWNCGAGVSGENFCPSCGKIQPVAAGADYFAVMNLPRRLIFDAAELEGRFHQLSWKLHPDRFVQAGEYEREVALERASQLNDAYRALRDPIARVEYVLARAGMRREGQQKQQAPVELLEEVFELNESLDELRSARRAGAADAAEAGQLRRRLEEAQHGFEEKLGVVDAEIELLSMDWDRAASAESAAAAGETPAQRKIMERLNDVLNRRSYIRNLVQSVQKELAES